MCLTPIRLKDGTQAACRGCEWCRSNRLNDIVGRCIAEQCTASKTFAVTLTYGQDTPNSAVLAYSDVQKMLRAIRDYREDGKRIYNVRYICAGEYGTKKGRAHWHIILFFYGRAPDVQIGSRIDWQFWPHGFSYFQNPDYRGFRYVMKYALKQDGNDGYSKSLAMSKKPPLGHAFFMKLADDMVERQLALNSPQYSFAHVVDHKQKPRTYWLQGRMRELFIDRYYTMWRMLYGKEPPWSDFLLEKYLDKIERKRMELDPVRYERDRNIRLERFERKIELEQKDAFSRLPHYQGNLYLGPGEWVSAYSNGELRIIRNGKCQKIDGNGIGVAPLLQAGLSLRRSKLVLSWLQLRPDLLQNPSLGPSKK